MIISTFDLKDFPGKIFLTPWIVVVFDGVVQLIFMTIVAQQ